MVTDKDKLFAHMPFIRLLNELEEFCKLNLNCEIYASAGMLDSIDNEQIEKVNSAFDKHGIKRSFHAPFMDLNPGSIDKNIKEVSINRLMRSINLCNQLKCKRMVAHTHFNCEAYKGHEDQWLKRSIGPWKEIAGAAKEKGITIAVENASDSSAWAALELIKHVDGLKACFDVAHYNVFAAHGWEKELIKYSTESIIEVHLSDNKGCKDEHLPLGEGNIDFEKFFNVLKVKNFNPFFVLEPRNHKSLLKGLSFLEKLATQK